ncbi:MAG TPA: hypothetical protein G4O16_09590 [Dehalococcoidia bacterium]|nr:hypothetical protein [Dehalococcoidia bacterium]
MMAAITYPAEIKTSYEKLGAVYSLIEQMRLEHNRQGAIARDKPDFISSGRWAEYTRIFRTKLKPLLAEQDRLRDEIRKSLYTDEEWKALDSDQRIEVFERDIKGDKEELKSLSTEATTTLLNELKAIKLNELGVSSSG